MPRPDTITDKPLKAALDYAQEPGNGGFWVQLQLNDGRLLVGAVDDHKYADEVYLHVYNTQLEETGQILTIKGSDVKAVWVDGDIEEAAFRRTPTE